ncbi:hypothetical protein CYMTET_19348, partial [Cymbomonas tetramitiformis]
VVKGENPDGEVATWIEAMMTRGGVSITVTSLTNILAFLLGSLTEIPAVKSLCYYAATSILCGYGVQITFFIACLALTQHRMNANRYDMAPCFIQRTTVSDVPGLEVSVKPKWVQRLVDKQFIPLLLQGSTKCAVVAAFAVFVTFSGFIIPHIEEGLPMQDLVSDDSYAGRFYTLKEQTFDTLNGEELQLHFQYLDQSAPKSQVMMLHAWDMLLESEYVSRSSVTGGASYTTNWLTDFIAFAQANGSSVVCVDSLADTVWCELDAAKHIVPQVRLCFGAWACTCESFATCSSSVKTIARRLGVHRVPASGWHVALVLAFHVAHMCA